MLQSNDYIRRHIGPHSRQRKEIYAKINVQSMDELIAQTVPSSIRQPNYHVDGMPLQCDEHQMFLELNAMGADNQQMISMIGEGFHPTNTPSVIRRCVIESPSWYTAYTPYQAEISQGRLELLLTFQHLFSELCGLPYANASLLDDASAAAEAMMICYKKAYKPGRECFCVDQNLSVPARAVLKTRASALGIKLVDVDSQQKNLPENTFGAIFGYPGDNGTVCNPVHFRQLIETMHQQKALVAMHCDPLALMLLRPPGEIGADIAFGSSQRFGMPMGAGGPHAAFFCVSKPLIRLMPGRIVGMSKDTRDKPALRLALQAREQHIRRDKATSNICTAQVLPAIIATLYSMYHGPVRLKEIAQGCHRYASVLASGLSKLGYESINRHFFDTIVLHTGSRTDEILERCVARGINLRRYDDHHIGISCNELTTPEHIGWIWAAFGSDAKHSSFESIAADAQLGMPKEFFRQDRILKHEQFTIHHSEVSMTRYLRWLANKDIALDRGMIPLGSCTMKLNAASAMMVLTNPAFTNIHPFAPNNQVKGYLRLFEHLSDQLKSVTGFDGISLQPNSGAQGEYAGLMCIRGYHLANNQPNRKICLIPINAHGTNPASARMAGMDVHTVECDEQGNLNLDHLRELCEQHHDNLAGAMVTYPSTFGVFEDTIIDLCRIIHSHGGQVYMDGANFNALCGLCKPAKLGADVMHINLHKTFSIPHGGGGPGMGPIGTAAHLTPFLPGHPYMDKKQGAVAAAPNGSGCILPISWSYMRMMGADGLPEASKVAILNANYIATSLQKHYPILYTGEQGRVAHECIIDLRDIKKATGISAEDIAKRLMDYGFHSPTMSWPVPDTMMIEPTESESLYEMNRFCDSMITIRQEIHEIEQGKADPENNLLKNAPHTLDLFFSEQWDYPYSRKRAALPLPFLADNKYWPPVSRVEGAFGDRNLVTRLS